MFFTQPEGEFCGVDIQRMRNNLPLLNKNHHLTDTYHSEQVKANPFSIPKIWAQEMGFFDPAFVDTFEAECKEFKEEEEPVDGDKAELIISIEYRYSLEEVDSSNCNSCNCDGNNNKKSNKDANQEDLVFLVSDDFIYSPKFLKTEPVVKYLFGKYESYTDESNSNRSSFIEKTDDVTDPNENNGRDVVSGNNRNRNSNKTNINIRGLSVDTSTDLQHTLERMQNSIRSPSSKPRTPTFSADNHWIGQDSPLSNGRRKNRHSDSNFEDQQTKNQIEVSAITLNSCKASLTELDDRPPFYPPWRVLGIPNLDATLPLPLPAPRSSGLEKAMSPHRVRRPFGPEDPKSPGIVRRPSGLEEPKSPGIVRRPSGLEEPKSPGIVRRPSGLEDPKSPGIVRRPSGLEEPKSPGIVRRPSGLEEPKSPGIVRRPSGLEKAMSPQRVRRPSGLEEPKSPGIVRRPSGLEKAMSPQRVRRPSGLENSTSPDEARVESERTMSSGKKSLRSGTPRSCITNISLRSSTPRAGLEFSSSSSTSVSFYDLLNRESSKRQSFELEEQERNIEDSEGARYFHDINMRSFNDIEEAGTEYFTLLFVSPDMPSPNKGGALVHWVRWKNNDFTFFPSVNSLPFSWNISSAIVNICCRLPIRSDSSVSSIV